MEHYNAVVIGSGPAGHTCAVRLAQLGARVAVIERDYVGGICTNWGCTPSKSMIESAKIARVVRESARYGVNVSSFSVDFKAVAQRRDEVIRTSRLEVMERLQHHNVDVFQGEAHVITPGQVQIRRGKLDLDGAIMHYTGRTEDLSADHIVLATGSVPALPDFVKPNDPFVVSSNRLITIGELPGRLTIVGGGVIGLEFATIFSNLGSQVTVIEFRDHVLNGMDHEISRAIVDEMTATGVRILASHRVFSVAAGMVYVEDMERQEALEIPADAILIATGRAPVIQKSMFDKLGIAYDQRGIGVDDYLRTSVPGVWAIGDATGKSILAHVGMQQGIVAAENIMEAPGTPLRKMDYSVIPAVVYSIPEIVGVGAIPADLAGVEVFKVPFKANLRAHIEAYDSGFIKIWVKSDRVVAAQAIGHNVSEIMQELANMIALNTPLADVARIIHAHPTYSEITRSALEYALGRAVDFVPEPVP
ncbi:MAG: dihydrolipoyl dehydrogenase [Anaerolineales bacterium]|nr:dihydrolipoyl dehydrogenase [Anaerolineales bacterium]